MSKLSDFDVVGKISTRANKFEPGRKKGKNLASGFEN
jgi:hypothetical protein